MTAQLLEELAADDERPWAEYRDGKTINAHGVGRLLRGYHVKPTLLRFGGRDTAPARGYRRADFESTWERYLPTPVQAPQSVTPLHDEPSEHEPARSANPTGNGVTVQSVRTDGQQSDLPGVAESIFAPLGGTWANGHDEPPLPPEPMPSPDDPATEYAA
jgi:hypothetical protein